MTNLQWKSTCIWWASTRVLSAWKRFINEFKSFQLSFFLAPSFSRLKGPWFCFGFIIGMKYAIIKINPFYTTYKVLLLNFLLNLEIAMLSLFNVNSAPWIASSPWLSSIFILNVVYWWQSSPSSWVSSSSSSSSHLIFHHRHLYHGGRDLNDGVWSNNGKRHKVSHPSLISFALHWNLNVNL